MGGSGEGDSTLRRYGLGKKRTVRDLLKKHEGGGLNAKGVSTKLEGCAVRLGVWRKKKYGARKRETKTLYKEIAHLRREVHMEAHL